jgi:hypothetical protein
VAAPLLEPPGSVAALIDIEPEAAALARDAGVGSPENQAHDPEKCAAVFGQDHAPPKS